MVFRNINRIMLTENKSPANAKMEIFFYKKIFCVGGSIKGTVNIYIYICNINLDIYNAYKHEFIT